MSKLTNLLDGLQKLEPFTVNKIRMSKSSEVLNTKTGKTASGDTPLYAISEDTMVLFQGLLLEKIDALSRLIPAPEFSIDDLGAPKVSLPPDWKQDQAETSRLPRPKHFVSGSCQGEACRCGQPAEHKVEETIFHDDPLPHRHPLTSYVCHAHFVEIMGPAAE